MIADGLPQLLRLFLQLGENAFDIGPVEAALVRPRAQLGGLQQRRKPARNTIERRAWRLRLLCPLDGVPVAQHLGGVDIRGLQGRLDRIAGSHRRLISEYVRVAADQLAVQPGDHIRDGEVPGLARHLGIEQHLQQKIAQLLAKIGPMPPLDGVEDLIALFEGIFPDGVEGLLAIPGATTGTAQPGHDAHCFGEKRSRIEGHSSVNTLNDAPEDAPRLLLWLLHC